MAQRRMFNRDIVKSDAFLDMPQSTQLLYFHLGMEADDDGFIGNAKTIARMVNSGEDDLKILLAKRFLLLFPNGIVVIKHWKINNYIQRDRYHETKYINEKKALTTKENGAYTECIQDVSKMDTESSLGKSRQVKVSSASQSDATLKKTLPNIPGMVTGDQYQPDGISPRDIQNAKPKRERTPAQIKSFNSLVLMDYFRDSVKQEHDLTYLHREEDRNAKMKKQVDSAYARFREGTQDFIDWWITGGGEWANYEPEAAFTSRVYREYENRDKINKKKKGREVTEG